MKACQFIGTRADILPEDYIEVLPVYTIKFLLARLR